MFGFSGTILPIYLATLNTVVASESASVGYPALLRYRISRLMLGRCEIRASCTLVLRTPFWLGDFLLDAFALAPTFA